MGPNKSYIHYNLSKGANQKEDQKLVLKTVYRLIAGQKYCRMLPLHYAALVWVCAVRTPHKKDAMFI